MSDGSTRVPRLQLELLGLAYEAPQARTGPARERPTSRPRSAPVVGLQVAMPAVTHTPGMPETRGDCESGPRPCRWTSCRHHLWSVEDRPGRSLSDGQRPPRLVVRHSRETCALDLADTGDGMSFAEIALVLGMTPERVRQVAEQAQIRLRTRLRVLRLDEER